MTDSALVQIARQAEDQAEGEVVSAILILLYETGECQLAIPVGLKPEEVIAYCEAAARRAHQRSEEVGRFN